MWHVPIVELACLPWQRQQQLQARWCELWQRPAAVEAEARQALGGWWNSLRDMLALPFDIARHQHAATVHAGALPRSLLQSQRFEQQLALMESLALGSLARRP